MIKLVDYQRTLPVLPHTLQTNDYLVPDLVLEWGKLVGVQASAEAGNWSAPDTHLETIARYRELCRTAALLLQVHRVTAIGTEALESAKHRWATKIDPWVALDSRVTSVFQAYRQEEAELIPGRAEKLWAALESRCLAVTGQSLDEVLA
jgi:hypothetical protein